MELSTLQFIQFCSRLWCIKLAMDENGENQETTNSCVPPTQQIMN